eukprot:5279155-Amphidinium_carterae.1
MRSRLVGVELACAGVHWLWLPHPQVSKGRRRGRSSYRGSAFGMEFSSTVSFPLHRNTELVISEGLSNGSGKHAAYVIVFRLLDLRKTCVSALFRDTEWEQQREVGRKARKKSRCQKNKRIVGGRIRHWLPPPWLHELSELGDVLFPEVRIPSRGHSIGPAEGKSTNSLALCMRLVP